MSKSNNAFEQGQMSFESYVLLPFLGLHVD